MFPYSRWCVEARDKDLWSLYEVASKLRHRLLPLCLLLASGWPDVLCSSEIRRGSLGLLVSPAMELPQHLPALLSSL